MILKIKIRTIEKIINSLIVIFMLAAIFLGVSFPADNVMGANVSNVSVLAKVNVSNTEPNLYLVNIMNTPIDLNANAAATVICNGSFTDVNGFDDIKNVSATLYQSTTSASVFSDDNNTHYTNSSCGNCTIVPGTSSQNGSCACQFAVWYYANAGSWQCNMTINDSGGLSSTQNSSFFTINQLLGINVESLVLDYGNLSVTQVSNSVRENVTNGGNVPINVTVRGFGGDNESIGENYTMLCGFGANITFGNQRYYPNNNTAFSQMYNLTNQTVQMINVTIPQRQNDASYGNSSNSTFWKLQIPPNAGGICNGTIIFGAIDVLNR